MLSITRLLHQQQALGKLVTKYLIAHHLLVIRKDGFVQLQEPPERGCPKEIFNAP